MCSVQCGGCSVHSVCSVQCAGRSLQCAVLSEFQNVASAHYFVVALVQCLVVNVHTVHCVQCII